MPLARRPAVTVVVFNDPRHGHSAALAARSAPVAASHGGGGCGLIDEHEAVWVEVELALEPHLARCPHIRPVLLGRVACVFLRDAMALEEARQAALGHEDALLGQSRTKLVQEDARLRLVERQDQVGVRLDPVRAPISTQRLGLEVALTGELPAPAARAR